jgi:hypothetical protein
MARLKLQDVFWALVGVLAAVWCVLTARALVMEAGARWQVALSAVLGGLLLALVPLLPRSLLNRDRFVLWAILCTGLYVLSRALAGRVGQLGLAVFALVTSAGQLVKRFRQAKHPDAARPGDGDGRLDR